MAYENGEWIMRGVPEDDPRCIRTPEALIDYIDEVGFLPLFAGDIPGLSVEERTAPMSWWSDDPKRDPWLWREILAAGGTVAYGKFFGRRAGFVSLEWLPYFANMRRGGYDFDARWDEQLAPYREERIMRVFAERDELFSFELRQLAGFGKGGEKNFEGTVTALQMQTYLVLRDFRCRTNRSGEPYGWPIAVYATPEHIWGYERVTAAYAEDPEASRERIVHHLREIYPIATEKQIRKLIQ